VENDWEADFNDFTMKTPKYLNAPLMVGANYTYDINQKLGIYGEAGLGANFRYITKLELEGKQSYQGDTYKYIGENEYDPTFTFAYQLGAGIEVSKSMTIGVNFYNLGSGKVSGKFKEKVSYNGSSDSDSEKFKYKRVTPTMVMLRVGFKF
jgi:opacity protein-like surface antigen